MRQIIRGEALIKILIRILIFLLGAYMIFISIKNFISIKLAMSIGNFMPIAFGVLFVLISIFANTIYKFSQTGFLKVVRIVFTICLVLFVFGFGLFVFFNKSFAENAKGEKVDAIIVLGASLNGTRPSSALSARLSTAANYLKNNPGVIVVVSGGQGEDEIVTEASVMKQYLIDSKIPESIIIQEDKSRNTAQNFAFSKILLDEHFKGKDYKIAFVTNDFHCFRSGLIAKKVGFDAKGITFESPRTMFFNYYLREYLSIIYAFITGII